MAAAPREGSVEETPATGRPLEERRLERWIWSGAAVPGLSHEETGVPCQDAVATLQADGTTVVGLADGAGSRRLSHEGAAVATRAVCQFLADDFDRAWDRPEAAVQERVIGIVRESLAARAAELSVEIGDLASTLLFVAVRGDRYLAGHLGDGVLGWRLGGRTEVLSHPRQGEFANETIFTTSRKAAAELHLFRGRLEAAPRFILMSDGSAEALYRRQDKSLAPAVATLWKWLEGEPGAAVTAALERSIRQSFRPKTRDDCSIVLLGQVAVTAADLPERSPEFLSDFLQCSRQALRARRAVAEALLDHGPDFPVEGSARCGFTLKTVQSHLHALEKLFGGPP